MKTIQKKISLENFKSRMPSLIPAYDSMGVQREFAHLTSAFNEPLTNYGMIPFNIKIDSIIVNGKETMGEYAKKWFTYSELSSLFHELDEKKDILKGSDKQMYDWLLNYCFPYLVFEQYEDITQEIKDYWGTDRLSFQDVVFWKGKMSELSSQCEINKCDCLCKEYEKRGGSKMEAYLSDWYEDKVTMILCKEEDTNHNYVYDVADDVTSVTVKVLEISGNTQTISEHSFEIKNPSENILGNNRYISYGQICKMDNNISYVINPYNIEIIDNKLTIPCLITNEKHHLIIGEPYFNIFFTLTNNVDDMGEMSSLCQEWESGYDYSENKTSQNCIVYYNNDNWILNSDQYPGYIYSQTYDEIYFGTQSGMTDEELYNLTDENNSFSEQTNDREQWIRYFDYFEKKIKTFVYNYTYKNGVLVFNPTPWKMREKYVINTNNGLHYHLSEDRKKIYPLIEKDYVVIDGNVYLVMYENQRYNPYIYIHNKKHYAKQINKEYKFQFDNIKGCNTSVSYEIQSNLFLFYSGSTLCLHPSGATEIYGVVNIDGNEVWFTKERNENPKLFKEEYKNFLGEEQDITDAQSSNPNFSGYTIDKDAITHKYVINVYKPYIEYSATIMSGYTNSKLDTLKYNSYNVYDNLGNYLNGLLPYQEDHYVFFPKMGDWLGIPYIPQYAANLEKINDNVYWGNFLKKITFLTENERIECETEEELKQSEINIRNRNLKNIVCEIEYYCGTILSATTTEENVSYGLLYENNEDGKYYGIKYVEKLFLTKKEAIYRYDTIKSCIVNYWEITQPSIPYVNEDYDITLNGNQAFFEYRIKPFKLTYGYEYNNEFHEVETYCTKVKYDGNYYEIQYEGNNRFICIENENILIKLYIVLNETCANEIQLKDEYFDYSHDMTISPLFRKEYNLGKSTIENVKANIYIDRGTGRVLDFHLRLLETKSMESLTQLGNGFFNITDNN